MKNIQNSYETAVFLKELTTPYIIRRVKKEVQCELNLLKKSEHVFCFFPPKIIRF